MELIGGILGGQRGVGVEKIRGVVAVIGAIGTRKIRRGKATLDVNRGGMRRDRKGGMVKETGMGRWENKRKGNEKREMKKGGFSGGIKICCREY